MSVTIDGQQVEGNKTVEGDRLAGRKKSGCTLCQTRLFSLLY